MLILFSAKSRSFFLSGQSCCGAREAASDATGRVATRTSIDLPVSVRFR